MFGLLKFVTYAAVGLLVGQGLVGASKELRQWFGKTDKAENVNNGSSSRKPPEVIVIVLSHQRVPPDAQMQQLVEGPREQRSDTMGQRPA
jgi:hypothetical protein